MHRTRPPQYREAKQLVSWLMAGDLLRFGSWELGILVFNGWDISGENLMALERIRREVTVNDFNAAGVRAYLGQRSMMEGPQESKQFRTRTKKKDRAMEFVENELCVESGRSEESDSKSQYLS